MRLVAARDITVADLPYISNPFFAKNDVRDAYCDGFTSIHNLNEFVSVQWRHYQQGLDELLKKIDKMEVCLVYSSKRPFLGVVYWQQDPDYPNNPQKGRWVASLSGINQYENLQGIVSSAYSKSMVPQTHSQQASLQSSTAKAVVNQGFENSVEGGRRNFLGQKQVMARPEEAERGDHVLQEATAFKQTDFASTYSMRLSQTPAETNDVVGTALTAGGLRSGLGLSRGTVVSSAGERVVPDKTPLIESESGGTLIFHENLDGHTIRRHVGKTDEQLLQRLDAEPDILGSSTYPDLETAQRAVGDVLSRNRDSVQDWLVNSPKPRLTLNETLDYEVGRVIPQGATVSQASNKSFVLLVKDPLAPNGYRVHTSFPKPND